MWLGGGAALGGLSPPTAATRWLPGKIPGQQHLTEGSGAGRKEESSVSGPGGVQQGWGGAGWGTWEGMWPLALNGCEGLAGVQEGGSW